MNLDDLISKYLDGELDEHEDVVLRDMLSQDEDAKYVFDSSVNLHLAFKEDAKSITPPDDFAREVEDRVLMSILSRSYPIHQPINRRYNYRYSSLAALIAVFLIMTLFKISDMNFTHGLPYANNIIMGNSNNLAVAKTTNNIGNSSVKMHKSIPLYNNSASDKQIDANNAINEHAIASNPNLKSENNIYSENTNTQSNKFSNISNVNDGLQNENKSGLNNTKTVDTIVNNKNYTESKRTVDNPKIIQNSNSDIAKNNTRNNQLNKTITNAQRNQNSFILNNEFDMSSPDIHFSSFCGSDLLRSGIELKKNNSISNFSIAMAFAIDSKNLIGVDVGYAQYNYQESVNGIITTASININKGNSNSSSSNNFNSIDAHPFLNPKNKIEVVNPGQQESYPLDVTVSMDRIKEVYWLSAFYERIIYKQDRFSINGRIGLGVLDEGFLGYSKIYANYNIIKGLGMSVGIDGRIFHSSMSALSVINPNMKKTISFIYGLQFSL